MKRFISLIIVLIVLLSCFSFSACGEEDENSAEQLNYVSVADFEQWGPDFQMLRLINNFGKITRNEDENFVYEGKYSAKLQPMGGYASPSAPIMYIPMKSTYFSYDYADLTKYSELSAYFYNTSDKPIDVTVGLISAVTSTRAATPAQGDTITLPPKQWKRVDYWFHLDLISLSLDIYDVAGIYFQFPNQGVMYPDDAPTIYLDDVRLLKRDEEYVASDLIELDQSTDSQGRIIKEICDFEKDYQAYVYSLELKGTPQETIETNVVNAEDYGITASNGNRVLRVLRHPSKSGMNSRIIFSQAIMQKVGMQNIPKEDWHKVFLKFDVCYTIGDDKQDSLDFRFSKLGDKIRYVNKLVTVDNINEHPGYEVGEWYWGTSHRPQEYNTSSKNNGWTTYSISLYELANSREEDYVLNPGSFYVSITNLEADFDTELYFDNFRMCYDDDLTLNLEGIA